MFQLGLAYDHGYGVESDINRAIELYEFCCTYGHTGALHNLAVCYDFGNDSHIISYSYMSLIGEGMQPNQEMASQLYMKAAEQGDSDSQVNLGM